MQSARRNPDTGEDTGWPGRLPLAAMAVTFALVALASFLPGRRLWGINHLAFYPVYVRIAVLAAAAAAFVPSIGAAVCRALAGAIGRAGAGRARVNGAALGAAAVSAGAFWLLRSSTLLLGDARLVASNFEHAFDPGYTVIVSSPRIILLDEPIAKGTALLYHWAARVSLQVFGASPVDGIRFLNCALGGILVFVLLRVLLKRPPSGVMAVWAALVILSSGAMELFFGYVENYTPLVFFGSLYMLLGLDYVESGRGRLLPAVAACLILTVFMHVQGVLLIPSFVFLLIHLYRKPSEQEVTYLTSALFALTAAGAFLFATLTGYGKHFLPAVSGAETFGVLTPSHIADIANELMLLLPMLLVVAAFVPAWVRGSRGAAPGGTGNGGGSKPDGGGARLHFILLVLFPCVLFLTVFKPDLGVARDWDLFAITALGLLPLALTCLERAVRAGAGSRAVRVTGPAAVLGAALALAWVGVNASPDRSARRFEAILEYDLTRAPYAYEVLAQHYRRAGELDRGIAVIRKGMSHSYNARLISLAAEFYDESGDSEEAMRLYREVLARQPELEGTRRNLVLLLHRLNRRAELLDASREGIRYHPEKPVYHYFYGLTLIDAGEVEKGIKELLICRRLRPEPEVVARIDRMLSTLHAAGYDVEERDSPAEFRLRSNEEAR